MKSFLVHEYPFANSTLGNNSNYLNRTHYGPTQKREPYQQSEETTRSVIHNTSLHLQTSFLNEKKPKNMFVLNPINLGENLLTEQEQNKQFNINQFLRGQQKAIASQIQKMNLKSSIGGSQVSNQKLTKRHTSFTDCTSQSNSFRESSPNNKTVYKFLNQKVLESLNITNTIKKQREREQANTSAIGLRQSFKGKKPEREVLQTEPNYNFSSYQSQIDTIQSHFPNIKKQMEKPGVQIFVEKFLQLQDAAMPDNSRACSQIERRETEIATENSPSSMKLTTDTIKKKGLKKIDLNQNTTKMQFFQTKNQLAKSMEIQKFEDRVTQYQGFQGNYQHEKDSDFQTQLKFQKLLNLAENVNLGGDANRTDNASNFYQQDTVLNNNNNNSICNHNNYVEGQRQNSTFHKNQQFINSSTMPIENFERKILDSLKNNHNQTVVNTTLIPSQQHDRSFNNDTSLINSSAYQSDLRHFSSFRNNKFQKILMISMKNYDPVIKKKPVASLHQENMNINFGERNFSMDQTSREEDFQQYNQELEDLQTDPSQILKRDNDLNQLQVYYDIKYEKRIRMNQKKTNGKTDNANDKQIPEEPSFQFEGDFQDFKPWAITNPEKDYYTFDT